jgi:acyl-[acyl-carrier-protein] desaturase
LATVAAIDDRSLLAALEPEAARLLDRHIDSSKEWFPHELVPYERGRKVELDREWTEDDADLGGSKISDGVRSALIVNILTEDNLPYYFRTIERMFGAGDAWGTWARRWTAEEGRHSMVIYGYLMASRAVDPKELERARMVQVSNGLIPEPASAHQGFAYVAMQELATRISHRNTGTLLNDKVGYDVMMRVAADENRHHLFYRDITKAALEIDPSGMVTAISREVLDFEMPGTGIPNFKQHAAEIAKLGIYDFNSHYEQVLVPLVLRAWNVENITGLNDEAERDRDRLLKQLAKIERVAKRMAERQAEKESVPA